MGSFMEQKGSVESRGPLPFQTELALPVAPVLPRHDGRHAQPPALGPRARAANPLVGVRPAAGLHPPIPRLLQPGRVLLPRGVAAPPGEPRGLGPDHAVGLRHRRHSADPLGGEAQRGHLPGLLLPYLGPGFAKGICGAAPRAVPAASLGTVPRHGDVTTRGEAAKETSQLSERACTRRPIRKSPPGVRR
jgi:hypothetical protein